ncbi:CG13654 [Drosophila busckii]|uniref:CG13654 n=1 Tax=Drosophila busckii TaxID=30019 RepID=A0A0M4EUN4_DROBS|nr:CG13654 [Drosophila busckii]
MKATVVLVALLYLSQQFSCNDSNQFHEDAEQQNAYHISESQQDKTEKMEVPKDQKLIVRLPSNTLMKYTSYKDVSILHFHVPMDSRDAYFTFKAFEEAKSAFQRHCKPKDISLYLKPGSFPVINPENITFPKNFISADDRYQTQVLQFYSDDVEQRIHIKGPVMGNWFGVAFISWTDPNNDRIEQQGLSASCDSLIQAELSVTRFYPIIINAEQTQSGNLTSSQTHNANNRANAKIQTAPATATNATIATGNRTRGSSRGTQHDSSRAVPQPQQLKAPVDPNAYPYAGLPDSTLVSDNRSNKDNSSNSNSSSNGNSNSNSSARSTTNNEIIYKFYVPDGIGVAQAHISFAEVCSNCPEVGIQIRANGYTPYAPPDCKAIDGNDGNEFNYMQCTALQTNQTEQITIEFNVQPNTWNYFQLSFIDNTEELPSPANNAANAEPLTNVKATAHHIAYTLQIQFDNETAKAPNNATNNFWHPTRFHGMDFYALLRQSYREFFLFDYDLQPDGNGTVPEQVNLTAQSAAGFAFEVGDVYDIGGTVTFAVSMNQEKEQMPVLPTTSTSSERGGILAEKLVGGLDETPLTKEQRNNQSMQLIVCMHLNLPGVPTWPDKCRYGSRLLQASSIVNHTENMGQIHVPFPETGIWYVTMGLYCHGAETARVTIIDSVKDFVRQYSSLLQDMNPPCSCAAHAKAYELCINNQDCLAGMNESETLKVKECMMEKKCTDNYMEMTRRFEVHHKAATEQHFAIDNCTTSVVFTISSSPCVSGRCGRFGRCYHYMSGGFVFSTCVCVKGYRGWDCTEDSQLPSSMSIVIASVLLTTSNLLFLPSVYMAIRRRYYTEGVIYFFAMFFSIFYHACDSGEEEYSFCLVKIGVLQFCDFYCGLLAIWVTLIAMANVPEKLVSLLHMLGAILLAFGTELNKQSLWVFLLPALTGICLISTSWGLRCAKTRRLFPARRYLTIFLPFGTVLVMIGLVCYAFLQTKQNYHIVHSIWHMLMAMSIMCLLPSRISFLPKC